MFGHDGLSSRDAKTGAGKLRAIVLAGGNGKRLASLTRQFTGSSIPKQFCKFGKERSLLQMTLERLRPLVPLERIVVVVTRSHETLAREQLAPYPGVDMVVQPKLRGTFAGVLLPLIRVWLEEPDASLLITPSDHGIRDERLFRDVLARAVLQLGKTSCSGILFGVEADQPRTDYGWIIPGSPISHCSDSRRVQGFVEKPSPPVAEVLMNARCLWSTMVLVTGAKRLLDLFLLAEREETLEFLKHFKREPDGKSPDLEEFYRTLVPKDFSRDVLQRVSSLVVNRWSRALGWSDLGTPERMGQWLGSHPKGSPGSVSTMG